MQLLLKKILILLLLVLLLLSPVIWVNKSILSRKLKGDELKLQPYVKTLIVGDSHAEKSLDPALIAGSVNASLSGESYFYTYYKLKSILKQNPGVVKNVVLSCSYHNFSRKFSEDTIFDKVKSSFLIGRYYQYLDDEGRKRLAGSRYLLFYRLKYDYGLPLMEYTELDTPNIRLLLHGKPPGARPAGFGGFSPMDATSLDQDKIHKKARLYFYDNQSGYTGCSQLMVDYLDGIASLCASNGITLYLYNAPLHRSYRSQIPAAAYEKYDKIVRSLVNRYPGTVYFDVSNEELDDKLFEDGDHLNKAGAPFASLKLDALLKGFSSGDRRH